MSFNPDISNQAHEVLFSRKNIKSSHPDIYFDNNEVKTNNTQKHLGLILDEKLKFNQHLKEVIDKSTKGIDVLRKLQYHILHNSLVTL